MVFIAASHCVFLLRASCVFYNSVGVVIHINLAITYWDHFIPCSPNTYLSKHHGIGGYNLVLYSIDAPSNVG